ncbi:MAG: hypothetical protein LBF34_04735 [Puniceicoccales bacterium]|jgi:hypothetical protein|nr:hypothetical protein [Puniceicoccales bacterium]
MQVILEKIKDFFVDLVDSFAGLFNTENWPIISENVLADPLFKWLILLIVLFLIGKYYSRKGANCIRVYTTNRGPVCMKKSALKNLVKKICRTVIPQSKSRVKLCVCWRRINLRVSVVCPYNMQSVSTQLQQEISRILKQEIGIKNLGSVHVVIEKIIGSIKAKAFNDGSLCAPSIASSSDHSPSCYSGSGEENTCCTNYTEYDKKDCEKAEI